MLSHVHFGTNDFNAAFAFYTPIMRQLGNVQHFTDPERQWAAWKKPGPNRRPLFIIGRPFDGNPAGAGNGQMVGFDAISHEIVQSCHAAALQLGAVDEGAPRLRPEYHPHYYGSYFRDLDGNKIAVVCHEQAGGYAIRQDDLSGQKSRELVALHLAGMRANSPPENMFALNLSGLLAPGVKFFTCWDGENIAGMAALKSLPGQLGEVKSMRTHPGYLRQGVSRRLLAHLLAEARQQGMTRLSLETGSGAAFEPALALYRQHGFADGGAFSDYQPSPFSQFLHFAF